MTDAAAEIRRLDLIGGALCLDFVNTVDEDGGNRVHDYLTNYAELLIWARHSGALTPQVARQLIRAAGRRPLEARRVHQRALELRSVLHRTFVAQSRGRRPRPEDLTILNQHLGEAFSRAKLTPAQGRCDWDWEGGEGDLRLVLHPVVRSAAELLTSNPPARVSGCISCGWLFVDRSKNHSRRWCSMRDCGNRAKARRHYRRTRGR